MNNLIYYVVSANFLMLIINYLIILAINMDIINEKLKNKKDKDERHI